MEAGDLRPLDGDAVMDRLLAQLFLFWHIRYLQDKGVVIVWE